MPIPKAFIEEIRARTDITALISKYSEVKKRGTRFVALCPFHSEKTPSFNITPELGLFYCFGCGVGGDLVEFVKRAENLEYADAVRFLGDRLGLQIPEDDNPQGFHIRRERLLEINRLAAKFFYAHLSSQDGGICREYLQSRGIHPALARKFGLGFAPARWDGLILHLSASGISQDEISAAGLVSKNKRGGLYDFFRERLMFPIFDLHGAVVGFSGRALGDALPKYTNSFETSVYRKSNILYGAHIARKSKSPYWILCEGNIDVIALHQAGFDNAVASCGTSLTDSQSRLIARHAKEVFIAYDSDSSGQAATAKAVSILEAAGVRARVLSLKEAKDPDDFIKLYGADLFQSQIEKAQNHIEYRLSSIESRIPTNTDSGKQEFLKEAIPLIASLSTKSGREVYSRRVAEKLGINGKSVFEDVELTISRKNRASDKQYNSQVIKPRGRGVKPPNELLEEIALLSLLKMPELSTELTEQDFKSENLRKLFLNRHDVLSEETSEIYAALVMRHQDTPVSAESLKDAECRIKNPEYKLNYYRAKEG